MVQGIQESIDRFIEYFKSRIGEIETLTTEHATLYRSLLYASVLDTLAGTVMPKGRNRERFTLFIKQFCNWSDGDRISLTHLMQLLRKNPDPQFERLREWSLVKFKKLPVHTDGHMLISYDPPFEEVDKIWPKVKDLKERLGGIDLDSFQHVQLLYVYRNTLVHELRIPGYGMQFRDDDKQPFYHHMTDVTNPDEHVKSIELVYPWRFLHCMCNTALDELSSYFMKKKLNPYNSRVFGTYWIRELMR